MTALAATPPRALAVVLHDVAPATWDACERVRRCVQDVQAMQAHATGAGSAPALPMSLLVVPRYHQMEHGGRPPAPVGARTRAERLFERWLGVAAAHGDELALHGYTHLDPGRPRGWIDYARRRWYTAGEGEFCALSREAAAERVALGRQWFTERGWPVHGFVAPAWLLSAGGWRAVEDAGFDYTCTLSTLVGLPQHTTLTSQSIVYSTRSGWRRALSVPWNAGFAWRGRAQPLLRFELHPCDADHPRVRKAWMGLLARALKERRAVTLWQATKLFCGRDGTPAASAAFLA